MLLDLVRGIAAILVLLSHWKIMFFVDYSHISSHKIWFAIPYVISEAGHQSVLIFFVLSGYLIGGSVFRSLHRGQWQWRTYLTHRFVRLWVVLLPGLLLGALWDWIGLHHGHTASLYNATAKSHAIDVTQTFTSSAFFGNIAFLQTILVPSFGSNGALWSLANEFWYYILFPLGWLALRRDYLSRDARPVPPPASPARMVSSVFRPAPVSSLACRYGPRSAPTAPGRRQNASC